MTVPSKAAAITVESPDKATPGFARTIAPVVASLMVFRLAAV